MFGSAVRRAWRALFPPWPDIAADQDPARAHNWAPDEVEDHLELPWRYRWDHLPKRTAGFGFSTRDYRAAGLRANGIARLTLGDDLWHSLGRNGYLDLPSRRFPHVTYRRRP